MSNERVLVIGAGAVGRVFGHHLQRGGARVTFFVREKYRADTAAGFTLYPLNGVRRAAVPVHGFDVVATAEELALRKFDAVYLTLSSPDVRGLWLRALVPTFGQATLVALQPSRDDVAFVRAAGVPEDQLVAGSIGLVSYAAPLTGETRFPGPGTAYWFPPLLRSMFSGPDARTKLIVNMLARGGLPAQRVPDVHHAMAYPTALGMAYLLGLERADWSFEKLHRGELLQATSQAMAEALAIVAHDEGAPPLGMRALLGPSALRTAVAIGRRGAPFPLETYLRAHFTKVRDQTHLIMHALRTRGAALGLQISTIARLLDEP